MRLEKHIGERVRIARENAGLTLEALGSRMEQYVGRPWTAQAVWQAENGKRDFKAAHIVALALALDAPLAYLFAPPTDGALTIGERGVDRPYELTRAQTDQLFRVTGHVDGVAEAMYEALVSIQKLRRDLMEINKSGRSADALASAAEDAVNRLYGIGQKEKP